MTKCTSNRPHAVLCVGLKYKAMRRCLWPNLKGKLYVSDVEGRNVHEERTLMASRTTCLHVSLYFKPDSPLIVNVTAANDDDYTILINDNIINNNADVSISIQFWYSPLPVLASNVALWLS